MIKKLFNKLFSRRRIEKIAGEKLNCIKLDRKKYLIPNGHIFFDDIKRLEVAKYPEFINLNLVENLKRMKCGKGDTIALSEMEPGRLSLFNASTEELISFSGEFDYYNHADREVLLNFIMKTIGDTDCTLIAYDSCNYKEIKKSVERLRAV